MVLWVKEGSEAPSSRATQTRVVWHECYGMACPASLQARCIVWYEWLRMCALPLSSLVV